MMILPGGVSAKALHEMSPDERAQVFADAMARVEQGAADMLDELRHPISFKGCAGWQRPVMTVVQHAASANTITVSHDGKIKGAWRLPLTFANGLKAGQPIVRVLQTEIKFQPMPLDLGFLLIEVPGWLASKEGLCQARSPRLSPDVEWTETQLAAWERLRKVFFEHRNAGDRAEKDKRKQQRYSTNRAPDGSRNGYYTISDIAFGRARLP